MKEAFTIKNEQDVTMSFVPYKENFRVRLAKDDSLTLDVLTSGEKIYYEKIAEDFKAKITARGIVDVLTALNAGKEVVLGDNVAASSRVYADKKATINLNGKTLRFTADVDTAGLIVKEGGEVTIEGGNVEAEPYAMDVNGGKLIVNSGNYYSNSASVIQVEKGECEIYGGTFRISDEAIAQWGTKYLLNVIDSKRSEAKITVYGGTFYGFNPEIDNSEEVKVAEGYKVVAEGNAYTVVKKED